MSQKLKPADVTKLIQHRTKLKDREARNALSSFVLDPEIRAMSFTAIRESSHGKQLADLDDEASLNVVLGAPEDWIATLASAVNFVNGKAKSISKPGKSDPVPEETKK